MTSDEIAKAREIIAQASPGPWKYETCGGVIQITKDPFKSQLDLICEIDRYMCEASDAPFIAAARTGWPKALTYAEDMKQHAQEWEEQYEFMRQERDRLTREVELFQKGMKALNSSLSVRNEENAELRSELDCARKGQFSKMERENSHLRAALEFYADSSNYFDEASDEGAFDSTIGYDCGARAREALGHK